MGEKGDPKPGTWENWEKFQGTSENKTLLYVRQTMNSMLTGPVRWFRETVVEPNQGPEYPYYHRRFRRVPTVDECYLHDYVCQTEANDQYQRDKMVEGSMLQILSGRLTDCVMYHRSSLDRDDPANACEEIKKTFEKAQSNFYIKYGDMPYYATSKDVLMKQKHRLVWERRHGENTLDAKRTKLATNDGGSSDGE